MYTCFFAFSLLDEHHETFLRQKVTFVDPVNATLSMPMWEAMEAPAVGPNPGKILTTPGGNPACQNNKRGNKLQKRSQCQAKRQTESGFGAQPFILKMRREEGEEEQRTSGGVLPHG